MSYLFIVNPVAGKTKAKNTISIIKYIMDQNKKQYEILTTTKRGDAREFAQEAIQKDFSTIVAVGGDGTINEVLNGMAGSKKILGIIPAGTGNDFARSLDLPEDPKESLNIILQGNIKEVDFGKINGKHFINIASIGLDAHIADEANKIKNKVPSTYAYILALLKGIISFKSYSIDVIIEKEKLNLDVMLVAICNGNYYGGGMKIAPNAAYEDGYFDICIIERMSKLKVLFLFPTIFKGNHVKIKGVKILRAKEIEIQSKKTIKINTDGEIAVHKPLKFKIIEKGLKILTKN